MNEKIERDGFCMVESVLSSETVKDLISHMGQSESAGRRNILTDPVIRSLAESDEVLRFIRPVFGDAPLAVRGIFFDKSPDANWAVPWHQDLSIAVEARHDIEGYGPWSVKDGVVHVQPPTSVLEGMLTIRIHLDDCDEANGPVRVVPGSHLLGKLREAEIAEHVRAEVACCGPAGGALIMRPLILHTSSKALNASHRRVIHLEYSSCRLPDPLAFCGFVP